MRFGGRIQCACLNVRLLALNWRTSLIGTRSPVKRAADSRAYSRQNDGKPKRKKKHHKPVIGIGSLFTMLAFVIGSAWH